MNNQYKAYRMLTVDFESKADRTEIDGLVERMNGRLRRIKGYAHPVPSAHYVFEQGLRKADAADLVLAMHRLPVLSFRLSYPVSFPVQRSKVSKASRKRR